MAREAQPLRQGPLRPGSGGNLNPGDERARTLASDLAGLADRSATGASWQAAVDDWRNWSTPIFTTATVT